MILLIILVRKAKQQTRKIFRAYRDKALRNEIANKEDFVLELFVELALCTKARLEGILNIKKKDLALFHQISYYKQI